MFYIKVCVGNILHKMLAHNIKTSLYGQVKQKQAGAELCQAQISLS